MTDLAPLKELAALKRLYLKGTRVADILVLSGLNALTDLSIDATNVLDLRPILPLTHLGDGERDGLSFENTPAARSSAELTRLSDVADGNFGKCARDTLTYLRTLPPYPDPLPWTAS